jgi:hypothetical protein
MSNVPAFRPTEADRLREVLKSQLDWVRHWRMDLAHGLKPQDAALADAEAEIKGVLAQQKECTDA